MPFLVAVAVSFAVTYGVVSAAEDDQGLAHWWHGAISAVETVTNHGV